MNGKTTSVAKEFLLGFAKGAKETPKAYFAPAVAVWRLLVNTTDSLVGGAREAKDRS